MYRKSTSQYFVELCTLSIAVLTIAAVISLFAFFPLSASAGHGGATVDVEATACGERTISASAPGNSVTNMYLVVHADGVTEYEGPIPTNGDDVSITVGPFTENTTVLWRIFGGAERDYDNPHWNGYGDPGFASGIADYAASVGGYAWVLSGPDDPNPFTTWNEIQVDDCDMVINGGGHILDNTDAKRKDWYDVSFGTDIFQDSIGNLSGNLEVTFHNVSDDTLDKSSFHASEISELNLFPGDSDSCEAAMNVTAMGSFDGEDGWKVVMRGGDSGDPASAMTDTLRVELIDPGDTTVYDTHDGDFADESSCVGTARTGIDNGNLVIDLP